MLKPIVKGNYHHHRVLSLISKNSVLAFVLAKRLHKVIISNKRTAYIKNVLLEKILEYYKVLLYILTKK